jgi:predicted nucleotidyltransferase
MRPHEALSQYREVIRAAVARYPLANPRVFGSVVAGCDTDDSDLDLLVDTLPGATLFDLGGLQVELEAALGVPVDVLTPGDLPQRFRDSVVREAMAL